MLTLKELKFRSIGRFVEEQSISFDSLGKLIQVDGKNNNTGGSSGAAKSTVFNALDFLFGLNSVPNSVLQSRLTEEPIWVEGVFDYDGLPLTITRGKKLKIDLAGEVTTGSSKLSEEKLDQILAIPRHLFKPMLHKEQGERGFFLNFTPKETNDFLTDCLGLSNFKKPMIALDAKLQELNDKKEGLSVSLEAAKTGVTASHNALLSLGDAPAKEVDQEMVLQLKNKADASKATLNAILQAQQKEQMDLEVKRPVSSVISFDRSIKNQLEQELNLVKTQVNQLLLTNKDKESKAYAMISAAKAKSVELQARIEKGLLAKERALKDATAIKKIRDSICPKCEQTWTAESAKVEEAQLLKNINEMHGPILAGEHAVALLEAAKEEIDYLSSNVPSAVPEGYQDLLSKEREIKLLISKETENETNHLASQNAKNRFEQTNFALDSGLMRDRHAKDAEQWRNQASLDSKIFEGAVFKLKSYDDSRIRYETSVNALKVQIRKYVDETEALSQALSVVNSDIESYEELKKAVKSYLSCSFDEALETISENATRLARCVPNMANATIQLMGMWETKDGKIREEVNAVLNLDGDENIDIRSLCGGERSAIDLAVDLSVIELIENKTNKGINIFVLDEPFTGLDTVCIEMALEVLKNSSTNKKLIIVDHNPEVKEMVESSLLVVRDGLTSKIIQS